MPTLVEPLKVSVAPAHSQAIAAPHRVTTPIPELDGLRGIAILLVFLTHFVAAYLVGSTGIDAGVYAIARFGWTGVDLFFVLSGFLITGILLDTKDAPHYWRNYIAKRCLRIFPLYFGVLFVAFVIVPQVGWDEPQFATLQHNQLWYWTYLVNVLEVVKGPGATPLNTSHLWSLCIEEQFYVVWPFIVLVASPKGLVRFAAWTMAIGLLIRLLLVRTVGPSAAYVLTPGRLDGLMIGAVLAVAGRAPGGLHRWRRVAIRLLAAGTLALLVLAVWRGMEYGDPVIAVAGYPLLAMTYGALLVISLTGQRAWAAILRSSALRQWGKYSYGLYLLHYPLLWALDDKLGRVFSDPGLVIAGSRLPGVLLRSAVGVPLAFGIAWASYRWYERRFLALKQHFA
jgi:peptidoglycan/LPS O-acetylase OafA/YrhL